MYTVSNANFNLPKFFLQSRFYNRKEPYSSNQLQSLFFALRAIGSIYDRVIY